MISYKDLALKAIEARRRAYAPYSGYKVGAALMAEDGIVYTGCNIENAAFTPTVCGERVALFKAVSEGVTKFSAIAVAGGSDAVTPTTPCGVCRQALAEFCSPELKVILVTDEKGGYTETTLGQLLPGAFTFAAFGG